MNALVTLGTPYLSVTRRDVEASVSTLRFGAALAGLVLGGLVGSAVTDGLIWVWRRGFGTAVDKPSDLAVMLLAAPTVLTALVGAGWGLGWAEDDVPYRATRMYEKLRTAMPSVVPTEHFACYYAEGDEALLGLRASRSIADVALRWWAPVARWSHAHLAKVFYGSIAGLIVYLFTVWVCLPPKWGDAIGMTLMGMFVVFPLLVIMLGTAVMIMTNGLRYMRLGYGVGIGRAASFLVDVRVAAVPQQAPADAHIVRVQGTARTRLPWLARIREWLSTGVLYHTTLYSRSDVQNDIVSWIRDHVLRGESTGSGPGRSL